MGAKCHIIADVPGFGEVYLDIYLKDGHIYDETFFWETKEHTPEEVSRNIRNHFSSWSKIQNFPVKVIKALRTSDINQENKVAVIPRAKLNELISAAKYEQVHEQLLPECRKNRCPKCASLHLSFTQQSSQTYNAGKGLVGNLVFGTVGALSGFESDSFERVHCMECGESWYASNTKTLCELKFDESCALMTSLELLKKLYNDCLSKVDRYEASNNYKGALWELATAIYYRLHCQTLLSAKERFDENNFYSICGKKVYEELFLLLDTTELISKYDAVKKAIVDASFIKNRAWAQNDLSEAIDKLFAAREADSADFIDIKDTFFMFNCPYCGKSYKTSAASKGNYIDCKNCHNTIEIKYIC